MTITTAMTITTRWWDWTIYPTLHAPGSHFFGGTKLPLAIPHIRMNIWPAPRWLPNQPRRSAFHFTLSIPDAVVLSDSFEDEGFGRLAHLTRAAVARALDGDQ